MRSLGSGPDRTVRQDGTGDPTSAGAALAETTRRPASRASRATWFRPISANGPCGVAYARAGDCARQAHRGRAVGVLKSSAGFDAGRAHRGVGRELRNGGLALGELIDLSLSHPHAAPHDPTMAIAGASDVPASPPVSPIMDEDANGAAEREATLLAETNSRLKRISTLASKIVTLSEKRVAGSGRGLTKSDQADSATPVFAP